MAQVAYDENKYRQGINTSYYDNAINTYKQQQEANRQQQINDAAASRDSALKQAYVTRMQNQQALNRNLAQSGIRGGATETSNLRLSNQYGAQRSAANTDYSNSVKSINQAIDQNIADYTSDMNSRAEEYRQNLAQARWQAEREDATNEQNRLTDYWSNFYQNYYSGYSKSDAKKALKSAEAALKKATSEAERIRIQQQIAGIQARRGVIANK